MTDRSLYGKEYYEKFEFGFKSEKRSDHRRILELLKVTPATKVLEIGCGYGILLNKFPVREKIGIELSDVGANKSSGRRLSVIKADAEKGIPFNDSLFDVIVMNEVIEHLKNPERVLKECFRVLKVTGKIIITTPVYHFLTSRGEERRSHFSEMGVDELKVLMKHAGFKVVDHEVSGIFFLNSFLDFSLFRPFRALRNKGVGAQTIDQGHSFADQALSPLSLFRKKCLGVGLTQLILAQKIET